MGFGMPKATWVFGKEEHPEAGQQIFGPLTEEGTWEISLLPLGRIVKADSAAWALYKICSLQQSTTQGITTYPAALRHYKTHFHTLDANPGSLLVMNILNQLKLS